MLPADFGLPEPPWIIAHRGASAALPENTLASAALAVEQKAHMLEVDVQLTSDGELLLVHDRKLEIDGRTIRIEGSSAEALRAMGGERMSTSPFPMLTELLEMVPAELPLNLDLKRKDADLETWIEVLLSLIEGRTGVLISSFDWKLLETLRRAAPRLSLAPIGSRRPYELLRAAEGLRAATINCHRRLAFSDFITAAGASGWPVLVYTINDPAQASSLFERGVSGVFTDQPAELLAALGAP